MKKGETGKSPEAVKDSGVIRSEKLEKIKRKLTWLLVLATVCVCGLGITSAALFHKHMELAKFTTKQTQFFDDLKKEKEDLEKELQTVKERVKNIKNKDDLLKRDIQLYIKAKYRTVSDVVAKEIAECIVELSKQYNVSAPLLMGIMQVESIFKPDAVSKKGAIGLMQVMPEWSKKFNLKNKFELYNIRTNIESGIKVLKIHVEEDGKGSITKGLYFYVNKDSTYADKVYNAAGKFIVFRSTVDTGETKDKEPATLEKEPKRDVDKTAKPSTG